MSQGVTKNAKENRASPNDTRAMTGARYGAMHDSTPATANRMTAMMRQISVLEAATMNAVYPG